MRTYRHEFLFVSIISALSKRSFFRFVLSSCEIQGTLRDSDCDPKHVMYYSTESYSQLSQMVCHWVAHHRNTLGTIVCHERIC
jgi:hypothetical protein